MILRAHQDNQLLLPVNPWFIWFSMLMALLISTLPLGRIAWIPDLLMLFLVFWTVHQPHRFGIGIAFAFGLVMDIHEVNLLGQNALSYCLVSFFAVLLQRRLLWSGPFLQALQLLPLFVGIQAVIWLLRLAMGGISPGWQFWVAPVLQAVLWPFVSVLLLAPQRRAPDRDENRPL